MRVRSTSSDVFSGLTDLEDELTGEAHLHQSNLSLVVDDSTQRKRKLPTLYLANAPVYADRSLERVKLKLVETIDALKSSASESFYLMSPCRFGELKGLYFRDLFNRSAFRRRLTRGGVVFGDDLYVTRAGPTSVRSASWGVFDPSFLIFPGTTDGELSLVPHGEAVWLMGTHKLGRQTSSDVAWLAGFVAGPDRIRTEEPEQLIGWFSSTG